MSDDAELLSRPGSGGRVASAVDTALIRRRLQHQVTAAERAHRALPLIMTRDVPALCDEVDRLREEALRGSLPLP
ncbi:hypothetical protein GCM10027053_32360 [Intrasporangium mesophilum]